MQNQKSKNILIIVLSLIIIGAIAAFLVLKLSGNTTATKTASSDKAVVESSEEIVVQEHGTLQKDSISGITELIQKYRAALMDGDADALKEVFNTEDDLSSETVALTSQQLESFENTASYIRNGENAGEYIVYIYDDLKLSGIDTLAPNLSVVYVKNDNGKYYIYRGNYDKSSLLYAYEDELQTFIDQANEAEDVVALRSEVYEKRQQACDSDEALKEYIDNLSKATGTTDEETYEETSEETYAETTEEAVETETEYTQDQAA